MIETVSIEQVGQVASIIASLATVGAAYMSAPTSFKQNVFPGTFRFTQY